MSVIRYRVGPTAGQAMCAVPRKRKFPEHYGSSRPKTLNGMPTVIVRRVIDIVNYLRCDDRCCRILKPNRINIQPHCLPISALPTASPSSFWSLCMVTVTRSSLPVNSNGAS
jgi:hypothetical protein